MGRLQRIEHRLESWVSRGFARAFRSDVQPVEISAALQRELDNNAQVVSRDRSLAPNAFVVRLSGRDHERLSPYSTSLVSELTALVTEHADLQRYSLPGAVSVTLEQDDALGTGQFEVAASVRADVSSAAVPDPVAHDAPAYLEVNGQVIPVRAAGIVIGRGSECDVRIDDPGVSRKHVEFRVLGEGRDADVVVVDLHSTNGTVVNGASVAHAPVRDGSQVVVGSTTIAVHSVDPRTRGV